MNLTRISFKSKPTNYAIIDNVISRSAQPLREDFFWLKSQGVTDIINFRTMYESGIDFDEKAEVEKLGMKYHSIPSHTRQPEKSNIQKFLHIAETTKKNKGKLHIHCKAGADRTGMYSFIYKMIKKLGTTEQNIAEWIKLGHNTKLFPELIGQTIKILINGVK